MANLQSIKLWNNTDTELDRICRRYWIECGKVITRKATPEERQRLEMRLANCH